MTDKRNTILAIDDDITILTSIRSILENNYEVSLARNAGIARTILQTADVNLILLDMEMPNVSGMEFLEMLQGDLSYYHIPVIIVSSLGTTDVVMEITKRGAVDFVVKPISAASLIEKVQSVLQTSKTKISKVGLHRKLQVLENTCTMGKSNRVEECINDIEHYCYDMETDLKIAEICKIARDMEYNQANEKVKQLLAAL